ncbi:MAG TPA: uracil-DNA glycosylase family protein [Verrucomicrobiales bacterium]|nr:uracil-DNA glycosylase family protein [Verrucomicrobiales bacterium]
MAIGSFDGWVNAAHRGKPASELVQLDVDALHGVSAGDKQHLEDAFGIKTIGDLASNRFFRAAARIAEDDAGIGHDPGPDAGWSSFFARAPLAIYQALPNDFRLDFGPVYYRGRLDGTARVLVVGQDPAANELVGHRAFVGASGQRVQGFLRRIGIRRDYLMVNTFLYPVFGQFFGSLAALTEEPGILGFRNEMLDRIGVENRLEAVVTVGNAAKDAVERWPGSAGLEARHITHPSALDHGPLLANWNEGLIALRNVVKPEAGAVADNAIYGTDWADADHEPVPRRDLPFGMPEWHGLGSRATRARKPDNSTDHKRIVWAAP